MSDNDKGRYLNYPASLFSAVTVFILSLFSQWVNWFAYDKLGYEWGFTLITPLILCMMYHFVQLDAGKHGNFSRLFFFVFAVLVPLAFSIAVTVIMKLSNPDMSVFDPSADYTGTVRERIAVYAGRFIFTSAYLLVFSAVDAVILRYMDKNEKGT
mgnify:CR=1 FL=1